MSVTALVVNFNAGDALGDCVASLLAGSLRPRILVLDNASTDGSAGQLQAHHADSLDVEVILHDDNLGFARAVNAGARKAQGEFLLVINPDCRVEPGTLEVLVQALEADPAAALAGPLVTNAAGQPERATLRRFPDPRGSLLTFSGLWRLGRWVPALRGVPVHAAELPSGTVRAEAVSGACMLIRQDALAKVGYLDEGYGLHCEDLDLMYRLHLDGWHCLFVPNARATHLQGVSSRSRPWWVHRQKHLGMRRFYRKFQSGQHGRLFRALVESGIWLHFLLTLPVVLPRR